MRDCLFVQWKKPTDASRFVIDGVMSEYKGTELQNRIIKLLSDVPKFKEICNANGDDRLSPSFRCSYHNTKKTLLRFVEGNFEERDTAGRKLVYILCTSEQSSDKVADKLLEYANILGVTPNKSDIEEIRRLNFQKKNLNNFLIVTVCLIIIIILLLLYM